MTEKEFKALIESKSKELNKYIRKDVPRIIGTIAKNHFDDNFRKSGFVDGGFTPWQPVKRDKGNNPPLTSGRNHLSRNTKYKVTPRGVELYNDAPYAAIHNNGGSYSVTQTITPKMRKFAWAKFFKAGGGKGKDDVPKDAQMWRGLALKKGPITKRVTMPKRQFIGESKELDQAITQRVDLDINNILNS